MQGRWLLSAWLCAVLGGLIVTTSAPACSCAPRSPVESFRESDGAIVARLVKVLPHGSHAVYRYEVRRVYRGASKIDPGSVLSVRSARRPAACALPRRLGHSYGLFLAREHGRWLGGICGVVSPRRMRRAAQAGSPARRPASAASSAASCAG